MAHYNTILNQITTILPRHEFYSLEKQFHKGAKFRSFNRWSQFMMMFIAQITGRKSLRDIIMNMKAQSSKLYHLGIKLCSHTQLARVNKKQPAELYEHLFYNMLKKCQTLSPKHRFKFKGKIYLLDASIIDLCLASFPWATFRQRKGAVKLHVGLDADGYLPEFVALTRGKKHEINWARALNLPAGSMVVFDMGFTDYNWYQKLCDNKVFFITRLKSNAKITKLGAKRKGRKAKRILVDRWIKLGGISDELRLVEYKDQDTGKKFRFITNAHHLDASTVAGLYKERWQIELFFKWIKQNLKVNYHRLRRWLLGTATPDNVIRRCLSIF